MYFFHKEGDAVMNFQVQEVENDAELYKMLGDRTRLTIFSLLKLRELCVCQMTSLIDITQPAISQHLKKMKLLNIIEERKKGQWVYYSIRTPKRDEKLLQTIIDNLPDLTGLLSKLDDDEEKKCLIEQMKNKK